MAHAEYLLTECVAKKKSWGPACKLLSSNPDLYRGSTYEVLKTEAADKADLMVLIKSDGSRTRHCWSRVPGRYAFLRAGGNTILHSPFPQVCSWGQKYITPHAVCRARYRNLAGFWSCSGSSKVSIFTLYAARGGSRFCRAVEQYLLEANPLRSLDSCPVSTL